MFRMPFSRRNVPLSGTPSVRRLKIYSAESGYVYQYFYEGYRSMRSGAESGIEFVFRISADRKRWQPVSVFVADFILSGWENANERELSATERYAVAKMALFHAFDEGATPAQIKTEVRLGAADAKAILNTLDL